jgi:hypothetical protein
VFALFREVVLWLAQYLLPTKATLAAELFYSLRVMISSYNNKRELVDACRSLKSASRPNNGAANKQKT